MTFDSDGLSVDVLNLRNEFQKSKSSHTIKARVIKVVRLHPEFAPKVLCRILGLRHDRYRKYVGLIRCRWLKKPENQRFLRENSKKEQVPLQQLVKLVSPPIKKVIKKSCSSCGWKIDKPIVVELYGIERVDNKVRANGHKWCVVWAEKPVECPCSHWISKHDFWKK